jgi:hypothetical protein
MHRDDRISSHAARSTSMVRVTRPRRKEGTYQLSSFTITRGISPPRSLLGLYRGTILGPTLVKVPLHFCNYINEKELAPSPPSTHPIDT